MLISGRWRIATLVAGALVIWPVICPGPVHAATASPTRTGGADGTHLVMASSAGELPAGRRAEDESHSQRQGAGLRAALASERSGRVSGVSCTSAVSCMAVGSFTVGDVSLPVLGGDLWNGTSWTLTPMPAPKGASTGGLSGVSCSSAVSCMAVGSFTVGDIDRPVLAGDLWNGTSWTLTPMPALKGAASGGMAGVSCASAASCMAVGSFTVGDVSDPVLAGDLWNGKSWTLIPMPVVKGAASGGVSGASCASAASCMAVGSFTVGDVSDPVLAGDLWNGKSWTLTPVPAPKGASTGGLRGVSCGSAASCMAVGSFTIGDIDRPYVAGDLWNGTSWTLIPMPGPRGAASGGVSGVSCGSAASCIAVGSFTVGDVSSPVLAGDLWNGKSWTLTPMPAPKGASTGGLSGVSCTSKAASCMAVGSFTVGDVSSPVLAGDLWNGKSWTLTPMPVPKGAPACGAGDHEGLHSRVRYPAAARPQVWR